MDYSFQLYSARKLASLYRFMPTLADLGYAQVEGFGGLYEDTEGLAEALSENGLKMPTGHFGLDQLKDVSGALKTAEALGIETLICPFLPPEQRPEDAAGWAEFGATLQELCGEYHRAGFGFAWHNHDYEFSPTETGVVPMEIMLESAPDISWQCDVAWVFRGRHDAQAWLERYADRITAMHVKDIAEEGTKLDEDGWADVGDGVLDWERIIKVARERTGCKHFVIEHDNPSDVVRFATRSIGAVRRFAV